MGFWSYYFLAKLLMYFSGFIGLHVVANLALAFWILLPTPHWALRWLKHGLAAPSAVALLYYDSWLPPLRRILAQRDQLAGFTLDYLLELSQRFVHWPLLFALGVLLLTHTVLARKLRMSSFAVLGLLLVPVLQFFNLPHPAHPTISGNSPVTGSAMIASESPETITPVSLDAGLADFYQREASRRVAFPSLLESSSAPFDIVILHVCSLAWDDLDFVGEARHPLLRSMDVVFDQFSAAASYSGPAAIRMLRASCGQVPHDALYRPTEPGCYLMNALQGAGYTRALAMNHDGKFGNFLADVQKLGGLDLSPMPINATAVMLKAFDGSVYHDDYAVLSQWWQQRLKSPEPRIALYYNTGTLHDGNRFIDGSQPGVKESYQRRVQKLMGDFQRFFELLTQSDRRVVVVMVPEHGANVRGDRWQISGLREIPGPAIAKVPVGIKLIAPGRVASPPAQVTQPSSHLAVAQLLSGFVANNPFLPESPALPDYLTGLAGTRFVAENEGTVVTQTGSGYWVREPGGRWQPYPSQ